MGVYGAGYSNAVYCYLRCNGALKSGLSVVVAGISLVVKTNYGTYNIAATLFLSRSLSSHLISMQKL